MKNEITTLGVKTKFILSLSAAMLLVGCNSDTTLTSSDLKNSDSESSLKSSKDENNEETSNAKEYVSYHNQGKSCLSCHGNSSYRANVYSRDHDEHDEEGEDDSDEQFTSGGTVYTAIDAANSVSLAKNYRLRLVLENTNQAINYSTGRGTANSYASYGIGTINSYTAEVVDSSGNVVNSSISNSHDVTRLDCNSCHTASGNNGAPGRITSYNYYESLVQPAVVETNTTVVTTTPVTTTTTTPVTTTPVTTTTTTPVTTAAVSFASDVMPVLENKCKVCHGNSGKLTVTTAANTYSNLTTNSFVDTAIDSSKLLTKGSGSVMHLGGSVIPTTSAEYQTLRDWISQGALNN